MLLFENKSCCCYTPYYCEENIWQMCKKVLQNQPDELQFCFAVFISNENKTIPLWNQITSETNGEVVVWDYHVIFVHTMEQGSLVYDLDCSLPFPVSFQQYCDDVIKGKIAVP